MSTSCRKVTQVKLDIKQIIENLKLLEDYKGKEASVQELKINTDNLLKKLECMPLKRLKTKLKKRQRKRHDKKLQKQKNLEKSINLESACFLPTSSSSLTNLKQKSHHQDKSLKECQRFLQTFELLQQLHLYRGQNSSATYKFSTKLQKLKSIWNCLLQEKLQEQTSTEIKNQQQWNEVLFGPPEKTYFQDKPDLQDFIRKRQIWDSYIDSKYGSSIPTGWIMPQLEVTEQWRLHLAPTTF